MELDPEFRDALYVVEMKHALSVVNARKRKLWKTTRGVDGRNMGDAVQLATELGYVPHTRSWFDAIGFLTRNQSSHIRELLDSVQPKTISAGKRDPLDKFLDD